jgi:hypothetical protein
MMLAQNLRQRKDHVRRTAGSVDRAAAILQYDKLARQVGQLVRAGADIMMPVYGHLEDETMNDYSTADILGLCKEVKNEITKATQGTTQHIATMKARKRVIPAVIRMAGASRSHARTPHKASTAAKRTTITVSGGGGDDPDSSDPDLPGQKARAHFPLFSKSHLKRHKTQYRSTRRQPRYCWLMPARGDAR